MSNLVSRKLSVYAFVLVGVFSSALFAKEQCTAIFKAEAVHLKFKSDKDKNDNIFYQDQLIETFIGDFDISVVVLGQTKIERGLYNKALSQLNRSGLTVSNIQSAHKILSENSANLSFRSDSGAKLLGDSSFEGFFYLSKSQFEAVDKNPFLTFSSIELHKNKPATGFDDVGSILLPSTNTYKKFSNFLSAEILKELAVKKNHTDEKSNKLLNQAILKELLQFSLQEAEAALVTHKNNISFVLARLEWRLKSLGLFYEDVVVNKGNYLENNFGKMDANRSFELAEAITDAFALKYGLTEAGAIERSIRPELTDSFDHWVQYMDVSLKGRAQKQVTKLISELKKLQKEMSEDKAQRFETFYMTKILTSAEANYSDAATILKEFKNFESKYGSRDIPKDDRVGLVPLDYIANFAEQPKDLQSHLSAYFDPKDLIYRGVSNPKELSDKEVAYYFKFFMGRFASELARINYSKKDQLVKLALLKFNADLISGRVTDVAIEHALKHMLYDKPNSSRTYFISTTDFDTVAFRFAVDKGYVDEAVPGKVGNTHMVLEAYAPQNGVINFNKFKQTDENFRNHFPRQQEVALAGGLDPYSLNKIYVVRPYGKNEKVPASGPEKHGKIVRIFERDPKNINIVLILEKNNEDKWDIVDRVKI